MRPRHTAPAPPHRAATAPSGLPPDLAALAPLLAAEAAAEADAAIGVDAADLEQAVWLRLLEGPGPPPAGAAGWLRAAVRAEARGTRRRARHELPHRPGGPAGPPGRPTVEERVLRAEAAGRLRAAVRRLPGRCPQLVTALLSGADPTYREIARELGISQGSLGPLRSRCLGCLRTALRSEG